MRELKDYKGREQTFLKHRVLEEYLKPWAHKLGSISRGRAVRLWYVDTFSGPWESADEERKDTSIAIGLEALQTAVETWKGHPLRVGAIFVEKDARAFASLQKFVEQNKRGIEVFTYHGEFGDHVARIQQHIGREAAFLFVDPTGWKGAAMKFIAPLTRGIPRRDVLINVMFHHINRFKDDTRQFLRDQMRDFFGLGEEELRPDLSEEELMALYRQRLKAVCGLKFAADLVVPHATKEQTKFRLVVGGQDDAVLELFRKVEKKVVGGEAAEVRSAAKDRASGQEGAGLLFGSVAPLQDRQYKELREQGLREVREELPRLLATQSVRYRSLWPVVLEACHITESDLKRVLWEMHKSGRIAVDGLEQGQRSVHDEHRLRLAQPSSEQLCSRCGAEVEGGQEIEVAPGRRELFCEQCRPR